MKKNIEGIKNAIQSLINSKRLCFNNDLKIKRYTTVDKSSERSDLV
jgi:hypothetical protein